MAATPPQQNPRLVILIPAYRARERVIDTFNKIPPNLATEIIIVDDASPDNTYALASTLPAKVYKNEHNLGYGGNMKVCLAKGMASGGDIFVELHADGQYDPAIIPEILKKLKPTDGMLLGSRLMAESDQALTHGMPYLKYTVNKLLTGIANVSLGTHLTEFQSGFRVYTRQFLETIDFKANSNDHLFSFETILQALYNGFTITEIPVICTYEPGVTQMSIRKGIKYSTEMLWTLLRYRLAKAGRGDPVFNRQAAKSNLPD